MVAQPSIALTTYPANEAGAVELPEPYVDAVRRGGGRALLVPPGECDPAGLLDEVDGIVLCGGGDLDPGCYGGEPHDTIYNLDETRDRSELALAAAALERGLPTLAICRGQQVVNTALGGTLHIHLPDVVGEETLHRAPPREPIPHDVRVEPGSLLAKVIGADVVTPMSWHHQAIDRLGDGLRTVAWAPDGTIEAIEHEEHPWLVAVQWHPELTAAGDRTQQRLFDALVSAAGSIR